MSPRASWTIRIVVVLAYIPACYIALVAIDSRSPWVLLAFMPVGFAVGEILRRLTASPPTRKDQPVQHSGER